MERGVKRVVPHTDASGSSPETVRSPGSSTAVGSPESAEATHCQDSQLPSTLSLDDTPSVATPPANAAKRSRVEIWPITFTPSRLLTPGKVAIDTELELLQYRLHGTTIQQLREGARGLTISTSGLKADIIQRLIDRATEMRGKTPLSQVTRAAFPDVLVAEPYRAIALPPAVEEVGVEEIIDEREELVPVELRSCPSPCGSCGAAEAEEAIDAEAAEAIDEREELEADTLPWYWGGSEYAMEAAYEKASGFGEYELNTMSSDQLWLVKTGRLTAAPERSRLWIGIGTPVSEEEPKEPEEPDTLVAPEDALNANIGTSTDI